MGQRITPLKENWTAGELKQSLHAREDLASYNNGAKRIENYVVLPEGGLTRRPGTRMVLPLKDESKTGTLLPFKYSRVDARMLAFNGGVARVFKSGGFVESAPGVPYEFAHPFADATLPNLRFIEPGNDIFLATGGQPKRIVRNSDTNWTLDDYVPVNGPVLPQNTDTTKTIAVTGVAGSIGLVANFDVFLPGHVGSTWRLDESDLSLISYWTADEAVTTVDPPATTGAALSMRRYKGNVYLARRDFSNLSGTSDAGANPPTQTFGEFQSQPQKVNWLFKYAGTGYVKITSVSDARHATASVLTDAASGITQIPDSVLTKPTYRWYEAAWSDVRGWPILNAFAQQRVGWFNATGYFWTTNSGDYYRQEITPNDDSAIQGQLISLDGSIILPRWAVSSGWFVIGGAEQEPVIRGPGAFDAILQTNVQAIIDKGEGSAVHRPAIAQAGVLHIGTSRQRLHYTKIDRLVETIRTDEVSVNFNHILRGRAAGLCYQHDPHRLAWGFNQDGTLFGVTFRPDQQVVGGHRHPMPNSFVEDIAVIPSADDTAYEVWMIVRRVIAGVTRRFVEVMQPFFLAANASAPDASGAWFLDCALQYIGPPVFTIGGAGHLAGASVGAFADGSDIGDFTVTGDGHVTFDRPVSNAIVGLRIPRAVETLPMDPTAPGRTSRAAVKRATHAQAEFFESFGGDLTASWQEDDGHWETGEPERLFDTGLRPLAPAAMALFSGRISVPLDGAHARAVTITFSSNDAYPSTLLALAPDIDMTETA